MKSKFMVSILLTLLAIGLIASTSGAFSSEGGNHGGGGGDTTVAAEFYQMSRAISEKYRHEETTPFKVSGKELVDLVARIKVIPKKGPLTLDNGDIVDAINFPLLAPAELIVWVDIAKWKAKKKNENKILLVIHELLGLLNQPDPQYKVSSRILVEIVEAKAWSKSNQKLLTMSQPDTLENVVCRLYAEEFYGEDANNQNIDIYDIQEPTRDPYAPVSTFKLEKYWTGGYHIQFRYDDNLQLEITVDDGPARSAAIRAYTPCSEKRPCEDSPLGHEILMDMSTSFVGEFQNIEVSFERYKIACDGK